MNERPKWVERWEKQRAKGAGRYIATTGISYGLVMFIAMTFLLRSPARGLTTMVVLLNGVVWVLAGFVFGSLMWWFSERRYRKQLKGRTPEKAAPPAAK